MRWPAGKMDQSLLETITKDFVELKRVMFGSVVHKLKAELTPSQGEVLMVIAHDGPLSVKTIAAQLHISSGAVTQLVDGLEHEELVERFISEEDRRVVWVRLSHAGKQTLTKLKKQYQEHFQKILSSLDDEELQQLHLILDKIITSVQTKE